MGFISSVAEEVSTYILRIRNHKLCCHLSSTYPSNARISGSKINPDNNFVLLRHFHKHSDVLRLSTDWEAIVVRYRVSY